MVVSGETGKKEGKSRSKVRRTRKRMKEEEEEEMEGDGRRWDERYQHQPPPSQQRTPSRTIPLSSLSSW